MKAQAVCDAAVVVVVVEGSWKKPGLFSIDDFVFAVAAALGLGCEWFEAQTKNDGKKEVASKNFARAKHCLLPAWLCSFAAGLLLHRCPWI